MPHQCLNCGDTFAEGSTDLLEGCPSCDGTRFFYTEEALEEDEREELAEQTDDDVESMLQDIVEDEESPDLRDDIWSREAWEEWIKLKASGGSVPDELADAAEDADVSFEEIADAVEAKADAERDGPSLGTGSAEQADEADPVQVELGDVEETSPPGEAEPPGEIDASPASADETNPLEEALQPASRPDDDGRPSTLNINDPGEYEIDVRRLLEDSPVIVERDGSYVIHLPSVFEREQ
jgi:predicted  nucleic acid-binding Zn-ribbon protein